MALLPGEIIQQRYRIISLLGRGPYGAVYRVWDQTDQQEYALKEYLDISPDSQKRFAQQAKQMSGWQHPQLPQLHDYFIIKETAQYLLMDYIAGVSLQELLNQYGPLPTERIIEWLQAASQPLDYLHQQGQIHANLKPANLRLTPQGNLFLVDTGLPALGIAPGTAGFAPPEQRQQQTLTPHSDVYSLGATLYTLLTNHPPAAALKRQSGLETLTAARDHNPDAPPYLSLVANRALSLNPQARYDTITDFANALNNPLGQKKAGNTAVARRTPQTITAPLPQTPPSRRPIIQTRTIWAMAVVFLLLVITVASYALIEQDELVGGSPPAATATTESQIIAVLTSVAPTVTPTPLPTLIPTPTPAPIIAPTGMRMLFMPGGVFRYGNDEGDPDEAPSQLVNLSPFYIDETEVTNAQYAQCVEAGACNPPQQIGSSYHGENYHTAASFQNYPVIFVTWYMADAFCDWRGARLPNEVEWERAASYDPTTLQRTLYPWGSDFIGQNLNFCDANCAREGNSFDIDDGHRDTAEVFSYAESRSPIGAYNMLGNVAEWVDDWYERDYYEEAPKTNPRGPATGEFKAFRGGSWFSIEDELGVTRRNFFDPRVARAVLGFRCATDVP